MLNLQKSRKVSYFQNDISITFAAPNKGTLVMLLAEYIIEELMNQYGDSIFCMCFLFERLSLSVGCCSD